MNYEYKKKKNVIPRNQNQLRTQKDPRKNETKKSDVTTAAEVEEAEGGDKNDAFYNRENLEYDAVYDGHLEIQTLPFES